MTNFLFMIKDIISSKSMNNIFHIFHLINYLKATQYGWSGPSLVYLAYIFVYLNTLMTRNITHSTFNTIYGFIPYLFNFDFDHSSLLIISDIENPQ